MSVVTTPRVGSMQRGVLQIAHSLYVYMWAQCKEQKEKKKRTRSLTLYTYVGSMQRGFAKHATLTPSHCTYAIQTNESTQRVPMARRHQLSFVSVDCIERDLIFDAVADKKELSVC